MQAQNIREIARKVKDYALAGGVFWNVLGLCGREKT